MQNLKTSLRRKRARPFSRYDQLPRPLRRWLQEAALPWSPHSVEHLWQKRMRKNGANPEETLAWLSEVEAQKLMRDARKIWGENYPHLG